MKFYKSCCKKDRAVNSIYLLKQFKQQFYFSYFNNKWIRNTFQTCFKTTTWSGQSLVAETLRDRSRSANVTLLGFPGSEERKKDVYSPCTECNGLHAGCFHRRTIRAEFHGSLNKSLDRDYYWKSRPRMLLKHRAKTGIRGVEKEGSRIHSRSYFSTKYPTPLLPNYPFVIYVTLVYPINYKLDLYVSYVKRTRIASRNSYILNLETKQLFCNRAVF